MKSFLRYFLLISLCTNAFAVRFEYAVMFPDNELKKFVLNSEEQDIVLPKSKWRCKAHKSSANEGGLIPGSIMCAKKEELIATEIQCGPNYKDASLFLFEGRKAEVVHQLMIICNKP